MATDRENFITENITSTSAMRDILMEMAILLNGRYAGNKDYLFERMDYLISCALQRQSKTSISKSKSSKSKLTVNKKTVKVLYKSKTPARCKKSGKFIARKKRK
jgi:hypothetical protein